MLSKIRKQLILWSLAIIAVIFALQLVADFFD
jgi:hypothetical protein